MSANFQIQVGVGGSNAAIDSIISGLTNISGSLNTLNRNFVSASQQNVAALQGISRQAESTRSSLKSVGDTAFTFNNIKSALQGVTDDLNTAVKPGADFNAQMKDLQAITGATDAQLKQVSESARQNAKDFGIDAAQGVEEYKLLLSQLSPELAKTPAALSEMGRNVSILSKQMGGNVVAATEVMTTALNQYGVSMDDPIQASKTMAVMMDIMSNAAREGSAELPQIKSALEQSGMMAKTANVSFAELNSAIQVLDKAGKKGAEGGVAIRNVLAELSQGAMNSPKTIKMLDAAGISVAKLADNNKSLSERLAILKPIANDAAAMSQLFGKENVAAAMALVQNSGEIDTLTGKLLKQGTAQEMANIVMESGNEKSNRLNAYLKDLGISIYNATDGFLPFINMGMGALQVMANLSMAGSLVSTIMNSQFVVSLFNGTAITSIFTGAQAALNAVLNMNPIFLIVTGVAALITGLVVAYNKSEKFRAAVSGLLEVGKLLMSVFTGLGKILLGVFSLDVNMIKEGAAQVGKSVIDIANGGISKAFEKGYDESMAASKKEAEDEKQKAAVAEAAKSAMSDVKAASSGTSNIPGINTQSAAQKSTALAGYDPNAKGGKTSRQMASNISSGGNRPTTVILNIHKLQDKIELHTTNLQVGAKQAAEQIVEQVLMALNSVNGKVNNA